MLDHVVIWGSPDDNATWAELDDLTRLQWAHPAGGVLKVDATCVDSGDGDWTDKVYDYCRPRHNRRILAIKGAGGNRPALALSGSKAAGGRLYIVGVDGLKTTIMNRLERGSLIRFSDTLQPVYFEQLTSERKVLRYVAGRPIRRFERKPGARAETLDCLVYAFAARQHLRLNFDHRRALMSGEAPAAMPQPQSPREAAELSKYGTIRGVPATWPAPTQSAAPRPPQERPATSPREQAARQRRDATTGTRTAPLQPRSPRETAEFERYGTIGGARPERPPAPSADPGQATCTTWADFLGRSALG